jgi:WD40 repeat protein
MLDRTRGKVVLSRQDCHDANVDLVAIAVDGRTLLTGSRREKKLRVWSIKGTTLESAGKDCAGVEAVSATFSPDGRRVALLVPHTRVWLWDLDSGRLQPFEETSGDIAAVAFSPDGNILAAAEIHRQGDHDFGVVQMWDPATRRPHCEPLRGFAGGLRSLAFAPNGQALAAGDTEGMVLILDPRTGEEKLTLRAGEGAVVGLCFAADARSLLSLSAGKPDHPCALHIWPACTDADVLAYLERNHRANPEDIEARIDLARIYAHQSARGDATAGKKARALLKNLTDRQCPARRRWLGLLK